MKYEYILIIIITLLLPIGIKLNVSGSIIGSKCKRWGKMFENRKFLKKICSLGHFTQGFIGGFLLIGYPWLVNLIGVTWYNRVLLGTMLTYPTYNLFKRYIFCKKYFWESSYFINLFEFVSGVVIGIILNTTQESVNINSLIYQIIIGLLMCINITSYLISVPTVNILTLDSEHQ